MRTAHVAMPTNCSQDYLYVLDSLLDSEPSWTRFALSVSAMLEVISNPSLEGKPDSARA